MDLMVEDRYLLDIVEDLAKSLPINKVSTLAPYNAFSPIVLMLPGIEILANLES